MNLESGPALVSGAMNLTLALIAWLNRRRDRLNISLALFTAGLALLSLGRFFFMAQQAGHAVPAGYHIPMKIFPLVISAAVYYILVLTGYIHRLSERIFGVPLRLYLMFTLIYVVFLEVLFFAWPTAFTSAVMGPNGRVVTDATRLMPSLQVVWIPLLAVFFTLLIRALREAKEGPRRRFLQLNTVGIILIFVSAPLIVITLNALGLRGRPYIFVGTTVSSAIFYFALIRYQFDQVHQLNEGLEQKVEQRTLHLREAQARLVQSEKMASLGQLVAGVSHEFNTPMGAVQSTTSTLLRQLDKMSALIERGVGDPSSAPETLQQLDKTITKMSKGHALVAEGAQRVSAIVQRLKSFARLDEADLQIIDLHQSIEDTLAMIFTEEKSREIAVTRQYGQLPKIACHPAQVNQILYNVLLNSTEAIEGAGEIYITTSQEGEFAILSIRDTGPGIPEATLQRIFEPGFTTKMRGIGTGLGLAISYQLMQDHQGSISVESPQKGGTTITLRFPLRTSVLLNRQQENG